MKSKSTTSKETLVARGRHQSQTKGRGRSKSKGRESLPKMNVLFVMRKDAGRKTV